MSWLKRLEDTCKGYGQNITRHFECIAYWPKPGPTRANTVTTPKPTPTPTTRSTNSPPTSAAGGGGQNTGTPSPPQAPSPTTPSNSPPPNAGIPNNPPSATITNSPPADGGAAGNTNSVPTATNNSENPQSQSSPNSGGGSSDTQSGSGTDTKGGSTSSPLRQSSPNSAGQEGASFPTGIAGAVVTGSTDSLNPLGISTTGSPSASETFPVGGVGVPHKDTNNIGAILGGVLGALAFLILLALAFLLMRRRRQRARVAPSAEFMQRFANSPSLQTSPRGSDAPYFDDQTNLPSYSQGQYPFVAHEKSARAMYQ